MSPSSRPSPRPSISSFSGPPAKPVGAGPHPLWLSQARKIDLYYYLVRTQPGWLRILEEQTKASAQISYDVLYGDWDAMISLHGIRGESETLLERITATTPYDWVDFTAFRVLFFHRHKTRVPSVSELDDLGNSSVITPELINGIIDNYDESTLEEQRKSLEDAGILLGSTWELDPLPPTDVRAYMGITLRGPVHNLAPQLLLEELLQDELIRTCMVHLVDLDRAKPFNYLAKLVCQDFQELDLATDAIGSHRIGGVTLETATFVVARGKEQLPLVTGQRSPTIVTPDTRGIESLAQATVGRLGANAIGAFNLLDPRLQPRVLDTLQELQEQVDGRHWDDEVHRRIVSALEV